MLDAIEATQGLDMAPLHSFQRLKDQNKFHKCLKMVNFTCNVVRVLQDREFGW
jgi:hypothetical protein